MTHTWKIYDLKRVEAQGMVTTVTYACESSEGNQSTRKIGEIALTTGSISDAEFLSFDTLTEDIVLGWIDSSIDKSGMETENSSSMAKAIVKQSLRTIRSGTPWD
mgnify:CR=1 FL=1|jgi:hypothetical protein